MAKQTIVVAHGMGDHSEDYHEAWRVALIGEESTLKDKVEVKGLLWDDLQDRVREIFPLYDERFAQVLEIFGLDKIKKKLGECYSKVDELLMDFLAFLFLHYLREWMKARCQMRLLETTYKANPPIMVGHSLGGVLMAYIFWDQREGGSAGTLLSKGLVMLGSPLGIMSPRTR